MRAALVEQFGAPESLVVRTVPDPVPGPGEVLIDVAAAGMNYPDGLVVAGTYQILPDLPFTPGKEVSGTILEAGPGVSRLKAGDRVLAQIEAGGYAERVTTAENLVVLIPDAIDFDTAAAFGLGYVTAHFALIRRAGLRRGETVLVTGAGGSVGSAAVQLAKAFGAVVVAVAENAERAALAHEQGADHVLEADPAKLRDAVRAVTDGKGADVVLELVGGELFSQALRATAWEGRVVAIGFASGDLPVVKVGHLLVKNIGVMGLQVSVYRDKEPDVFRQTLEEMLDLAVSGALQVPVEAVVPLTQAGEALGRVMNGTVRGKLVLKP